MAPVAHHPRLALGIDLGTSGCRACVIDSAGELCGQAAVTLPPPRRQGVHVEQDPASWWDALHATLRHLFAQLPAHHIAALAVDGTSGTLLLTDPAGVPLGPALLYNDARAHLEAQRIAHSAPPDSAAHGATSSLAKLLFLQTLDLPTAHHALSPADWISAKFTGRYGVSDEHNCLKLGYDPVQRRWPDWLDKLGVSKKLLPSVLPAGTPLGPISAAAAHAFGLAHDTLVVAGTTDSTAAFIASGAGAVGEAVTSLGSTLVLKVVSAQPVFAPAYGVYSHRLGDVWLAGGGSNSGGAVLRHYFSAQQLAALTPLLRPDQPTGLDYYPLLAPGERFPVNDAHLAPCLTPRPVSDVVFFQALLEGMARIEQRGYQLLAELGAPYPTSVRSVGGGAVNTPWKIIRENYLRTRMLDAAQHDAAYGAALLAQRALRDKN